MLQDESILENVYTAFALNAVFHTDFSKFYSLYIVAQ